MTIRLFTTFAILLFTACAATSNRGPVSAPELRPGESWTYRQLNAYSGQPLGTIRYEIVRAEPASGRLFRDEQPYGESIGLSRDGYWLHRTADYAYLRDFLPPYAAFPFPLSAGKDWTSHWQARHPATGETVSIKSSSHARDWERVSVPAGEFDALKIVRHSYADDREWWKSPTHIVEVDWYAPEVNGLVKRIHDSEYHDYRKTRDSLVRGERIRWELLAHKR